MVPRMLERRIPDVNKYVKVRWSGFPPYIDVEAEPVGEFLIQYTGQVQPLLSSGIEWHVLARVWNNVHSRDPESVLSALVQLDAHGYAMTLEDAKDRAEEWINRLAVLVRMHLGTGRAVGSEEDDDE